ncbi:MAG: copper-binding protein, partial [Opitutaceae bacterium]|nr:copper-binding protein [Opitutaceae bacterium]
MTHSSFMPLRLFFALLLTLNFAFAADEGHPLRGVVTRILEDRKLVLVKHEEIPGFMRAMTMAFSVPEADWPKLESGVYLTATLHGGRGDWRLRDIVITDENHRPLAIHSPAPKAYPLSITPLTSPASSGAAPALFHGTGGVVGLGWIEQTADQAASLNYALLNPGNHTWSAAETVATGSDWVVSELNCPQFALTADGTLTALWYQNNPSTGAHSHGNLHAMFSQKPVGGTWSQPAPLTRESQFIEFAALAPLADGRVLAVWLDGRAKRRDGGAQQLYGRLLGFDEPDQLIDDSVCDCCPTTLTAFPNGDALIAYRARREAEVRDIHTSVFREGQWTRPRILSADEWSINGCPVNGPQLDSQAGQVAAVWFTAADGVAKVLASASPDAGARFLQPRRIDLGHPRGQADVVQLRDGSRIVTWLEGGAQPGLWLKRISAQDEIGPPVRLAAEATGRPQIALLKDYDAAPAQLLVVYATEHSGASKIKTQLVTLPALSLLAGRAPCLPCDEKEANASLGFGVKGVVMARSGAETVTLQFDEIPGVMRAGTLTCQVEPSLQA